MKRAFRFIAYVLLFPFVAVAALILMATAAALSIFDDEESK